MEKLRNWAALGCGLRWSERVLDHLRSSLVILGHLSYERSSSMLYVGMDGWMGLDWMVINDNQ